MTINIMLDLETWGTEPGDDIRSIGAVVFDPAAGTVGGVIIPNGKGPECFHIACDNPIIPNLEKSIAGENFYTHWDTTSQAFRKYPLRRDPRNVQWWSEQSAEAQAAFADPVNLCDALKSFGAWLRNVSGDYYHVLNAEQRYADNVRLWCHGPSFDEPILRTAYLKLGLPVPWHYRAPRDTRTIMEAAGMDPHKGLEPFNTGTHHNALDDAITQARAVCEAFRRLRVPHDVVTHRDAWRDALNTTYNFVSSEDDKLYWQHEKIAFDRTFEALANHPQLEK